MPLRAYSKVIVFGASLGGAVAIALAHDRSDAVRISRRMWLFHIVVLTLR